MAERCLVKISEDVLQKKMQTAERAAAKIGDERIFGLISIWVYGSTTTGVRDPEDRFSDVDIRLITDGKVNEARVLDCAQQALMKGEWISFLPWFSEPGMCVHLLTSTFEQLESERGTEIIKNNGKRLWPK